MGRCLGKVRLELKSGKMKGGGNGALAPLPSGKWGFKLPGFTPCSASLSVSVRAGG